MTTQIFRVFFFFFFCLFVCFVFLFVSLRLFSDVTIKLSGLFSFLMSDLMFYFVSVFIVPLFSKKIEGNQYSALFSSCTQLLLLHFLKIISKICRIFFVVYKCACDFGFMIR